MAAVGSDDRRGVMTALASGGLMPERFTAMAMALRKLPRENSCGRSKLPWKAAVEEPFLNVGYVLWALLLKAKKLFKLGDARAN
jgi:hypothetical protein